jgi:hypothetical protein
MEKICISKAKQPIHAISGSLNENKEPNLTTNHRLPRAKRFVNYAFKTGKEGVVGSIDVNLFINYTWMLSYMHFDASI